MDLGGVFFFLFLTAIILVPQVLRHQERGRLHDTLRMAFERGQPVPPELIAALQSRRRVYAGGYDALNPDVIAGWRPRPAAPEGDVSQGGASRADSSLRDPSLGDTFPGEPPRSDAASVYPAMAPSMTPIFVSQARRDLRRGVIWLAVGLGLLAAGGASYAGLYEVGGAQETFSLFAAFGAIPIFIGLTYLALAGFARSKTPA